jgi:hypothetical protein
MRLRLATVLTLVIPIDAWAAGQSSGAAAEAGVTADAVSTDDWDWGGFTGLDDAPVISRPQSSGWWTEKTFKGPGEVETAAPDYGAPPRPAYAVFEGVPPFEVIPSQRDADMHPCSNCHQWVLSDPNPRALKKPHDSFDLQHGLHGKGKFWCFTCHHLDGAGGLKTLEGEKLDFSDAYILCSQCHVDQARDWVYGAHGKRAGGWQGTRQVLNCTACHYQHRPALKARAPQPGPEVRMGLQRPAHWVARKPHRPEVHGYEAVWKNAQRDDVGSASGRDAGKQHKSSGDRETDDKS